MRMVLASHWLHLNFRSANSFRLPNGKVELSAKAPRTRDGMPDLSGVWQTLLESTEGKPDRFVVPGDDPRTFNRYFLNILTDFKPDDLPMRPAAVEGLRRNVERLRLDSPTTRCLPQGLPRSDVFSYSPF